ncbi:MAG: hypothetical protein J0M04_21975 [Verrucomicrobia bacterium]|nr:hypothetical protein [Verrucomicrobiota bacterium]
MATFVHPSSLNKLRQFTQACGVLRNTTRATNPAWYQDALDLETQIHIRVDGPTVSSFLYLQSTNTWHQGPTLAEGNLRDPALMTDAANAALKLAQSHKATSLGVILHIADEFATAELKPELDNPASLPDLRDAAERDPASILDDSSIPPEQNTWRVIPYPAQGSQTIGTTISLTRQYAAFLDTLRQTGESNNFPIIACALSSPLEFVMGFSDLLPLRAETSFVVVLQYPWFTTLVFYNDHADLKLIRTLQHRFQHRAANLRHALSTTNASLELVDPDIFILALSQGGDPELETDLTRAFPASRVSLVTPPTPEPVPPYCLEMVVATSPADAAEGKVASHTFDVFRTDKWSLQNFLPPPPEAIEIYPSRSEMLLLRATRLSWIGLAAVAVLTLAWLCLGILGIMRREEWSFDPKQTDAVKTRLAKLTSEKQKTQHWDNLLEDRSKAWCSMELLSRMIPERSGIMVKNFAHTSKPDIAPGKAKIGFVKEWKITGFAREESLDLLNALNTQEGISARFSEVAKVTGNAAFDPAVGNRSLSVNARIQENSTFKFDQAGEISDLDESTYGYSFDLTVSQRYEATDPLAINVSKVP